MNQRLVGVLLLPSGDPESGELWFESGSGVVVEPISQAGGYDVTLSMGGYRVSLAAEGGRRPLGEIEVVSESDTTLNERLMA